MQRRTFSQSLWFLGWLYAMWGSLFDDFGIILQPWSSKVAPGTPQGRLRDKTTTKLAAPRDDCALFLDPRATQKEYSCQFGSQNDSKMEVKMEPTPGLWTLTKHAPAWSDCILDPPWGAIFPPLLRGHQQLMKKSGNKARFRKKRVPNLKKAPRHSDKLQNGLFLEPQGNFPEPKKSQNGVQWHRDPKRASSGRVEYAIRTCQCMFCKGRECLQSLHFDSIFESFWEPR